MMCEEIKLLPCPFCGSSNVNLVHMNELGGGEFCVDSEEELTNTSIFAYVRCYNCDISFMSESLDSTPKDVLEAWNRRK